MIREHARRASCVSYEAFVVEIRVGAKCIVWRSNTHIRVLGLVVTMPARIPAAHGNQSNDGSASVRVCARVPSCIRA
jgi:hypothetical protein